MDLYPYPTDVIATFYSLSMPGMAIGRYSSIVLMILCHMFFFNRKMACKSFVSAFMANTSNFIIKSTIFFFPCLKVLIFHLVSTTFVLSLNVALISRMNSSQSWVSFSSSSSLSFLCAYIHAIPPLRWARIAVILSSVPVILLLLRNNLIPLYQSSNFIQSLSNHPGSSTMLLVIIACMFSFAGAGVPDISVSICSL